MAASLNTEDLHIRKKARPDAPRWNKSNIDYSLYLVTDSSKAILQGRDFFKQIEAALDGGVTIVQYRDKTSSTNQLIATARQIQTLTKKHGVPFIINDRADVAKAIGADGLHIGQDDIDLAAARQILGEDAIIGVTASSENEAIDAVNNGADYLGIGTIYATKTKENAKSIIGTDGCLQIMKALGEVGYSNIPCVAIGGINAANLRDVLVNGSFEKNHLNGLAVVSCIMSDADPEGAASDLRARIVETKDGDTTWVKSIGERIVGVIKEIRSMKPLSHNMTNLVVQNFAANVALAIGASPIMANYGEEAKDLCELDGALVINMGSVDDDGLENYRTAIRYYFARDRPILFDPVGAGATHHRRAAVKYLMEDRRFDVIKGNEGEISVVAGKTTAQQKGVDSLPSSATEQDKASLVVEAASKLNNVIVMTGKTDFLSDGDRGYAVHNGHELLGEVTGTGCALGTVISACLAAYPRDKLIATLAGVVLYGIAAEDAAGKETTKGPGTFVPNFIDSLSSLSKDPDRLVGRINVKEMSATQ